MSNNNPNKLTSHSTSPLNAKESELFEISERVLAFAKAANCTAADLSINMISGAEYSIRNGEPETIERNQDKNLSIQVFNGDQTGSASTTDFSDQALQSTVNAAASIAKVTEGDPCLALAEPDTFPTVFPDLDLHHPDGLSAEKLGQFALEQAIACEAAALGYDTRISNTEGASFSAHEGVSLMRTSKGFTGFARGTRYGLSCSVIAGEQDAMQRDYWYDSQRKLGALESAAAIGEHAAKRTLSRLNARKIKTCKVPVILDATMAPGFVRHLIQAISGNAVYKKATFLTDKIDTVIFPEHINIGQTPHLPQGMGSAVYDADGVATQAQNYIEDGRLISYVLSQYSACKLGLQNTGNAGGVRNLSINHDDLSQQDLLKRMGTGLLVTEMMGFGVNTVTGDYSRGAAGFWVENGEIQYPVHEITLSGNLSEMFKGISGIANDTNTKGNIHSGSILLNALTVGGS
ncbi:MAG: metalloprotease PmbA [Arenicellales bacterium]